jgi:cytoskeletal protein CcmA (bactofilin family)
MNRYRRSSFQRHLLVMVVVLSGCLGGLTAPNPAWATEFRGGDAVHLGEGEILDDLFIAAGDISVNAHIVGDLFAGGATVTVGDSAIIENSVAAAAQRIDINGTVINSVRAFAQDVSIRGHIQRNVIAFCATLILDESGWVENDITIYSGKLIVRGRVGGDITGTIDEVVISGQINGNIDIKAGNITILPSAIIGGKLRYRSEQEASIAEGAQVFEGVERVAVESRDGAYTLGSFLWDAWWFWAAFIVGAALLILFKRFTLDTKNTLLNSSLTSLGLGFLFLVCLPVASGVLVITLLGIPLAVLVFALWLTLLYLAKIFVGLAVGEWLLARLRGGKISSPALSLLAGLLILTVVSLIPYVGLLVKLMICSLGMGAFFLTAYRYRTRAGDTT